MFQFNNLHQPRNLKIVILILFLFLLFNFFYLHNFSFFSKSKEEIRDLKKKLDEKNIELESKKKEIEILKLRIFEVEEEFLDLLEKYEEKEEKKRNLQYFLTNPDFQFDYLYENYQNPFLSQDEKDLKFYEEPNKGKKATIKKITTTNNQIDYQINYPPFILDAPHFLDQRSFDKFMYLEKKRYNQVIDKKKRKLHFDFDEMSVGTLSFLRDFSFSWAPSCNPYAKLSDFQPANGNTLNFEKLLIINSDWIWQFQHWIDHFGCLIMDLRPLIKDKGWTIFVQYPSDEILLQLFDFIKKDLNVNIVYQSDSYSIHAEYALFPCTLPKENPRKFLDLKHFLLKSILETDHFQEYQDPNPEKIIYLPRVNNLNGRNIVNSEEVVDYLKNRYGENLVIFSHKEYPDLKDLVQLFSSAKVVVGLHGGAFYNIIFSLSHPVVIEFHQPKFGVADASIYWISHTTGSEYWRLFSKQKDLDSVIDLIALEQVLNLALKGKLSYNLIIN
ncbi:hypothetical protein M0811_08444 [Anaeramoeba ignava]|uniref:Glycosyltransferase 61 catalytic domain-containing protein n=1 Tax=Anaeramoeba ignava TaxID=1746090 RepID=A0A9Q0LIN5_ANAIG|nr:hypothetical protein M0811_08444 [Anaeramoeba ignava]